MKSSHAYGMYKFHMKDFSIIEVHADKVITYGNEIFIFLKGRIIMKLEENEVLCWNLKS